MEPLSPSGKRQGITHRVWYLSWKETGKRTLAACKNFPLSRVLLGRVTRDAGRGTGGEIGSGLEFDEFGDLLPLLVAPVRQKVQSLHLVNDVSG